MEVLPADHHGFVGAGGEVVEVIFTQFIFTNLGFMIFNLIPIPPLDGSRVLYAIAPDSIRRLMMNLEGTTGIVLVFILISLFGQFFSNLMVDGMNAYTSSIL